jgi:hypothetical protein
MAEEPDIVHPDGSGAVDLDADVDAGGVGRRAGDLVVVPRTGADGAVGHAIVEAAGHVFAKDADP